MDPTTPKETIATYKAALTREFSTATASSSEDVTMASDAQAFFSTTTTTTQPIKRGKSLVRPERERIDENHRQYHYRQAAGQAPADIIQPSKTGNLPSKSLSRSVTTKSHRIRRGKSVLGREEEKGVEVDEVIYDEKTNKKGLFSKLPGPWMTYCYLLTCCVPPQILSLAGIPKGLPQRAWREKIGLVGVTVIIMAFVGFLTFGFTSATCPAQPVNVHGNAVSPGYLVIKGNAYMLADWQNHPGPNGSLNVLYPPMNGAGMDASLLFPTYTSACDNTFVALQGKQPNYFPCELFNPNNTVAPSISQYTNRTNCHLTSTAIDELNSFTYQGVPTKNNGHETPSKVYYNYQDVNSTSHLMLYNGNVLNLRLLQSLPPTYFKVPAGGLVDQIIKNETGFGGRDMTYLIQSRQSTTKNGISWKEEAECLSQTIRVGQIDTMTVGCVFSEIVLYVSLAVILVIIFLKFFMAVIFGWFLSWKLGSFKEESSYAARMRREEQIENWAQDINDNGPVTAIPRPPTKQQKRRTMFPTTSRFTPLEHGSTRFDSEKLSAPIWKGNTNNNLNRPTSFVSSSTPSFFNTTPLSTNRGSTISFSNYMTTGVSSLSWDGRSTSSSSASYNGPNGNGPSCPFPLSPYVVPQPPADYMPFNYVLAHTICLVTCYSEGEDGIRTTLDSICVSDYPNSHKLLLVVCDGLITGSGETKSTPDVCIGMMRDLIVPADQVQAQPYVAIGDGSRRNNCAKVYAGYYKFNDATVPIEQQQRVPMITIVKCGGPDEAHVPKPGNRGKRDSQIILMQFLQKVMFDERMTLMEYEFFNAIWRITGVPADQFEICLMVDADTKLYPDALSRLISAAVKDPEISGLCGETKIANKKDSWVTMMQVFEYYISHHQSKAFESMFGGVTCLPGCFCMYRIKAPKGPNGYWVPILANPDIVEHYSENVVDTLHRKNLLLLGEDRYLTTLMLRTFPNRKMMFVPQAVCKTIVPDTFKVLLSQRRRWINSTVHNLFELILVNDLCGTFCFSMQFVVFIDIVGTLALPAAISFTLYLIVIAIMGNPAVVPLILLAFILGLPAVLIAMTSRKMIYIAWMMIYLITLPIWNFVLPIYSYWHFDDFSWGDTRKVEGVTNDKGHGDEGGQFDSSVITMKKWSDYEMDRRIKLAQEHNLPQPRFIDRHLSSMDIFRDLEFRNSTHHHETRRYSNVSRGSGNVPLTQMDYSQSNYQTDTTSLGIIPTGDVSSNNHHHYESEHIRRFHLSDSPSPPLSKEEEEEDHHHQEEEGEEGEEQDLGWIQKSTHDNNWADPAPHHNSHYTIRFDVNDNQSNSS